MLYFGIAFGILVSSLTHKSLYSIPTAQGAFSFFVTSSNEALRLFNNTIMSQDVYVKFFFATTIALVIMISWRQTTRGNIFFAVLAAGGLFVINYAIFTYTDIPYVLVLFFVLTYHILSWFFFFIEKFYKEFKAGLPDFILWHIFTIVPLVVLVVWVGQGGNELLQTSYVFLFNMHTYLTVTLAHLASSLLNEPWVKNYLRL